MSHGAGEMRETLVLLTADVAPIAVAALSRSGSLATASTTAPHGLATGEWARLSGAAQDGYNGRWKVTVTGPTGFTFAIAGTPATPATGTITAAFDSDAQGNLGGARPTSWRTVDTIPALLTELHRPTRETITAGAMQAANEYGFIVRARSDFSPQQRMRWTPSASGGRSRLLVINDVAMDGDGRTWMTLWATEATS